MRTRASPRALLAAQICHPVSAILKHAIPRALQVVMRRPSLNSIAKISETSLIQVTEWIQQTQLGAETADLRELDQKNSRMISSSFESITLRSMPNLNRGFKPQRSKQSTLVDFPFLVPVPVPDLREARIRSSKSGTSGRKRLRSIVQPELQAFVGHGRGHVAVVTAPRAP